MHVMPISIEIPRLLHKNFRTYYQSLRDYLDIYIATCVTAQHNRYIILEETHLYLRVSSLHPICILNSVAKQA